MLRDLLSEGLLACPVCRGWQGAVFRNAHLVELSEAESRAGRLWQGLLACAHCAARFPVIDGVAVILKDVGAWARQQERALMWRDDLPEAQERWLRGAWGDDQDPNWRRQMLAVYGRDPTETSDPSAPSPLAASPLAALAAQGRSRLRARVEARLRPGARVLEVGCGAGQLSLHANARGARVLALDHDFGPLRLLSKLLLEGAAPVPRWRHGGGDFIEAELRLPPGVDPSRMALIAGDAQDPPLMAGAFDLALAINVLDNVSSPVQLLRQLHAALRPGGELRPRGERRPGGDLIVSSPFDWSDRATPRAERLGDGVRAGDSPDPVDALRALLTGGLPQLGPELRMQLLHEERQLPWVLQRHDRSAHVFFTHLVEARRC